MGIQMQPQIDKVVNCEKGLITLNLERKKKEIYGTEPATHSLNSSTFTTTLPSL